MRDTADLEPGDVLRLTRFRDAEVALWAVVRGVPPTKNVMSISIDVVAGGKFMVPESSNEFETPIFGWILGDPVRTQYERYAPDDAPDDYYTAVAAAALLGKLGRPNRTN